MRLASPLPEGARTSLLGVARSSIHHGLRNRGPLPVDLDAFEPELREVRACFVTLRSAGELRGCIGSLDASRPLVADVAHSAHAAAFRDPRFAPVERPELQELRIHIAVLSPLEKLEFASRAELISKLQPGIDGILLTQSERRGTFLPAVWESLPDPEEFVSQLERKACLTAEAWSRPVDCFRYTTEDWGE